MSAIARLIDRPAGQRPVRTVVDGLGMGEPIEKYYERVEQITSGLYNAFGMGGRCSSGTCGPAEG